MGDCASALGFLYSALDKKSRPHTPQEEVGEREINPGA